MFNRCVVSGIGAYSPYGIGFDVFADNYNHKISAIKPLTLFSNALYEHDRAAVIEPLEYGKYIEKKYLKGINRVAKILIEAMGNLLFDYDFKKAENKYDIYQPKDILSFIGTYSSFKSMMEFDFQSITEPQYITASNFPYCVTCSTLGYAAIVYKMMGGCITLANGVSSALDSIGLSALNLENSRNKMFIAGGVEELSCQHALLIQNDARFLKYQNPVLGEGAALIALENELEVKRRNGRIYADILGYSSVFCNHIKDGLLNNLELLKKNVGTTVFQEISDVFLSENQIEKELFPNQRYHSVSDKIGFTLSASGGFKVIASIASNDIPPGAIVLINEISQSGHYVSLILKKR